MGNSSKEPPASLYPSHAAPQHGPRPLPLFLELVRRETQNDPDRARRVLAGLRLYQEAPRSALPEPGPAIAERDGASLRACGGPEQGEPVLFVPSLINPPRVLDLPGRSLIGWLTEAGHRVLMVDWGWPDAARSGLDITGHVEKLLLPLIDTLDRPLHLVGYCLGGTMALAAAARAPAASLATIAAPWHFSFFPEEARASLAALWRAAQPSAQALGLLPMEVLQSAFWHLDPARTVAKFESFPDLGEAERDFFVLMEDWANDGPPLGFAAAEQLFRFFADDLPGNGGWIVKGSGVDPDTISAPMLHIVSSSDRIVPEASAPCPSERLTLSQGHVGMIAGRSARAVLWEPLGAWLSRHRRR